MTHIRICGLIIATLGRVVNVTPPSLPQSANRYAPWKSGHRTLPAEELENAHAAYSPDLRSFSRWLTTKSRPYTQSGLTTRPPGAEIPSGGPSSCLHSCRSRAIRAWSRLALASSPRASSQTSPHRSGRAYRSPVLTRLAFSTSSSHERTYTYP